MRIVPLLVSFMIFVGCIGPDSTPEKDTQSNNSSSSDVATDTIPSSSSNVATDTIFSSSSDVEADTISSSSNDVEADTISSSSNDVTTNTIPSSSSDVVTDTILSSSSDVATDTILSSSSNVATDTIYSSSEIDTLGYWMYRDTVGFGTNRVTSFEYAVFYNPDTLLGLCGGLPNFSATMDATEEYRAEGCIHGTEIAHLGISSDNNPNGMLYSLDNPSQYIIQQISSYHFGTRHGEQMIEYGDGGYQRIYIYDMGTEIEQFVVYFNDDGSKDTTEHTINGVEQEHNAEGQQLENTLTLCQDGIDNDSDGFADCDDQECKVFYICQEEQLADNEFIDSRDQNRYTFTTIGNTKWMTQNLNYRDVDSDCYDNDESNCDTFGALYDHETAITACPNGWRLPYDSEWMELLYESDEVLYGDLNSNHIGNSYSNGNWDSLGIQLTSTEYGGNNLLDFNIMYSGWKLSTGEYVYKDDGAFFWTSTQSVYTYGETYTFDSIEHYNSHLHVFGFWESDFDNKYAVRCVQ